MENVVQSWTGLLDALRAAGDIVTTARTSPTDTVEGLRYVVQLLGDQLDRAALRDSAHPIFAPAVTPLRKLFFDNPDTSYDLALVSGSRDYCIRGNRGGATYLAFCAYAGDPSTGTTRPTNLSDAHMRFDADGTFELWCTRTRPPDAPNWLPLGPDTHAIIARQYFVDRATQRAAHFEISTLGGREPDPPLDTERFVRATRETAQFVQLATSLADRRARAGQRHPNQFIATPGPGVYGTPEASYVTCWYALGDGDALVLEVRPPQCRYWGVHLANRWGQSLDARSRRVVINGHTARPEDDGTVRIVIAPSDPGVSNWLDSTGHPEGWALFRWLLSDDVVIPTTAVVPLDTIGVAR